MRHLTERCGRHECADTRRIGLDRFLKERGQRATGSGSHRACRRRSHRRPEPAAGRGRAVPRAGAAHRRRRGLRQNPRADAPHRLDPHPVRRLAQPDPGHHVHQQGRRRDARTPDRTDRAGGPAHVGVHLPLRLRAHPAARRRADRAEIRILHLRHRRLRAPGQAHRRRSEHRPQTLYAPLHPGAHLRLQEQPAGVAGAAEHLCGRLQAGPEGLPARPVRQRGGAVRGRLRRIPAPARHGERRGLRRPDRAHRRTAARLPDGRRILPAQVPLHPRRRVPGHQPRAVRARAGAGRRGCGGAAPNRTPWPPDGRGRPGSPSSATPTSRSTRSAARTSATSRTSNRTSRTPRPSCSNRTTVRRRPSWTRRTRSSPTTRAASPRNCGPRWARASRSSATPRTTPSRRRRGSPPRSRGCTPNTASPTPTWPSCTGPTRSRARWRRR